MQKSTKHHTAVRQPEIRIQVGWLLKENVSIHLHELWGKNKKLADDEWLINRVEDYKKAWQPYEKKVLDGITDILDLSFRQNTIDVYIAPWFSAFSNPLVIGVMDEPDLFVDTLTHELLHRLLTDNTAIPYDTDLIDEWKKLFGKELSFKELVHIPVHAAHKSIYLDVLKEKRRLQRDYEDSKSHDWGKPYVKSWDYVEREGYIKIIEKLKKSYSNSSKTA